MKYQKGDKVVIREDLKVGKKYGNVTWLEGMEPMKSMPFATILWVGYKGSYVLDTVWAISEEMISHKYEEKRDNMKYQKGDKVVIRKELKVGEWYGNIQWWDNGEPLKEKDFIVIDAVDEDGDYVINGGRYITDEMISHKYEEEHKYVWYFEERGETYFLTKKALIRASSRKHLRKVLNGEVDGTLITEEEAKQSTFFHFGILSKHTPPPKEQLYYVCVPTSTGNLYMNYLISEDVYYAGSIIEDDYHRTKFTEEEADKIIGTSTVLYKKEVE